MRRQLLRNALWLAVLASCGSEPDWVLFRQEPKAFAYIDRHSVRRNGKYIVARTRLVYTEAITDLMAEKPHWSKIVNVSIDCDARSWTTLRFETFDEKGATVEKKEYPGTIFYVHPDWKGSDSAPRLACEHVNDRRPLVPQSPAR
jgi:hypothetical protein